VLGGGMRQAGILAAAGIYALDHHINRLPEDHARARELGAAVRKLPYVKDALDVETNIVVFTLNDDVPQSTYLAALEDHHLKAVPFGPQRIRLVTHLDFGDDALEETIRILGAIA
ncbi:MAG: beta-eliminating lyase-related protein, partial [Bacteroidota bacterium]